MQASKLNFDGKDGFSVKYSWDPNMINVKVSFERQEFEERWQEIFECETFQHWAQQMTKTTKSVAIQLTNVHIQHIIGRNPITKLIIDVQGQEGSTPISEESLILCLPSAAVVILLRHEDTHKDMCLFIERPRMSKGSGKNLEILEGKMTPEGQFEGPEVAVVEKICDIKLERRQMVCMTGVRARSEGGEITLAPNNSCQNIKLYLFRRNITSKIMTDIEESDNNLRLVNLGDSWWSTADAKSMVALFLVHELRYHMLMPKYKRKLKSPSKQKEIFVPTEKVSAEFIDLTQLEPYTKGINLRIALLRRLSKEETTQGGRHVAAAFRVGDKTGTIIMQVTQAQLAFIEKFDATKCLVVRNGKIDMSDGHMKLQVDQWGKISCDDETGKFEVNEENDMSATEYELVGVSETEQQQNDLSRKPRQVGRSRRPMRDTTKLVAVA